jgi:hypothetical protein
MMISTEQIIDAALKIGSVSGLVSLIFTIQNQIKKRSKFKFDFRSHAGRVTVHGNLEFYEIMFDGYVKNQSNEQNSITDIFYSIWGNKSRTKTLANGMGAEILDADDRDKKIPLPILFEAKEGKHLIIKFSVCLTGTHVNELIRARLPVQEGLPITLPKYEFTLAFKDVDETLFDDKGKIRSQKLIDLWWTLPNTFTSLKTGNPIPYFWHMFRILLAYLGWKLRLIFSAIGF